MIRLIIAISFSVVLASCSTLGSGQKSDADVKAESCRQDPYQDMCQPGYVEP